jgi:hypothetical protein
MKLALVHLNLKYDYGWLRIIIAVIFIWTVLYAAPSFVYKSDLFHELYETYRVEKQTQEKLDTKLEYQLRLIQVVVWAIAIAGFLIGFWTNRKENRKMAFQKLVESQLSLMQDQLSNKNLMKFFDSMDRFVIRKNKSPGDQIDDIDYFFVHLAKAMVLWEQAFNFRIRGWIDRKTWQYWDRQLREVYIGQSYTAEYPSQDLIESPPYRTGLNDNDRKVYSNWYVLFLDWWHERQNYRYYHCDFVKYVYSIIGEIQQGKKTRPFLL